MRLVLCLAFCQTLNATNLQPRLAAGNQFELELISVAGKRQERSTSLDSHAARPPIANLHFLAKLMFNNSITIDNRLGNNRPRNLGKTAGQLATKSLAN